MVCKRMTALLMAALLSASCLAVDAAEVYTKQEFEEFDENVSLLSPFGLLEQGREAATTITRGEFAAVMLKYLGYEKLTREMLEEYVQGIYVYDDGRVEVEWKELSNNNKGTN